MPACTEQPAHTRHAATMQCSPSGLAVALAVIIASYLSFRHYAGMLQAVRITAALMLALAGLGLLTWVTAGLSRRSARTAARAMPASASEPATEPATVRRVPDASEPATVPAPAIPITLITKDGRTLVLANPGPITATESRS